MSSNQDEQTIRIRVVLVIAGFVGSCLILSSCGEQSAVGTEGIEPVFSEIFEKTMSNSCVQCHEGQGNSNNGFTRLDFSTQSLAYNSLRNGYMEGQTGTSLCGENSGIPLIVSGQAENSYAAAVLVERYNDQQDFGGVSGCEVATYHIDNATFSKAEQDAFAEWIDNGALNN